MAFILVVDPCGLSLDFCLKCLSENHTVKFYTEGKKAEPIGQGLVDKVTNWKKYMDIADLIYIPDNLDHMEELVEYKKKGYPVFGPDKRSAKLELDRMYGQEVINEFGGKTIPSIEFSDFDQAIQWVKENPGRYCSKPVGEVENKALTFISKDEADLIGFLTRMKKTGKKEGLTKFILQEFKAGAEFCVTGIFGPNGWAPYWFEGFEFKKNMNDDLGVSTGEMGSVYRCVQESKIADMIMKPMEPLLHSIQYTGFLDVNCIVDEKTGTPWPMEWTARTGFPTINILMPLIKKDIGQWMIDVLNGNYDVSDVDYKTSVGVLMANSDFPHCKKPIEEYLDYPIITDDADIECVHPCEVKLSETIKKIDDEIIEGYPEWGSAGTYLVVCTGVDNTISKAKDKAYKQVKNVKIGNDVQYRTDIGENCPEKLKILQKFGFASGWKY